MGIGIDIKMVQERYHRMTDKELIRVLTQDAFGLTPEAVEVVKAEIRKRGLSENLGKAVEAQNRSYTVEELDVYCRIVSNLNCPSCGRSDQLINATLTAEVMSFILFTNFSKKIKVGCAKCLDSANNSALAKTVIFGWWGVPWGLIRTPQAIAINLKSKRTNHLQEHNDYLRGFTMGIIGEIETYKDNKEKLQRILERQNDL